MVAVLAIVVTTAAGYAETQAGPSGAALSLSDAMQANGRATATLEAERQKLITQDSVAKDVRFVHKPALATAPHPRLRHPRHAGGGGTASPGTVPAGPPPGQGTPQAIAMAMLPSFGFATSQFGCLNDLWIRESNWRWNAENPSGAYGIPQALPGAKMASAGADWQDNPATQIKWGLGYIKATYGTPCAAWAHEEQFGSY